MALILGTTTVEVSIQPAGALASACGALSADGSFCLMGGSVRIDGEDVVRLGDYSPTADIKVCVLCLSSTHCEAAQSHVVGVCKSHYA